MVLEKDGEDELDRSCRKWKFYLKVGVEKEHPTDMKQREVNWIGHISRRNCLL